MQAKFYDIVKVAMDLKPSKAEYEIGESTLTIRMLGAKGDPINLPTSLGVDHENNDIDAYVVELSEMDAETSERRMQVLARNVTYYDALCAVAKWFLEEYL